MTMVATDSYRLAVKRTELEGGARRRARGEHPGPGAARAGPDRLRRRGRGRSRSRCCPTRPSSRQGRSLLNTRLIEGQFPNFRQLLPESYEHDVRLPRREFLDVTRRVSQLAQRNAPLRLSFARGELTVAAETPDVGDAEETMPAAFEGEPLEIGFNPRVPQRGDRERRGRRGAAAADLAAAAGPAAAGRQRRTSATW